MKEEKRNSNDSDKTSLKKCSSKDSYLENLFATIQRAELKREEKLKRFYGKASTLYATIKRHQDELNDDVQLKNSDTTLLQQRLRDVEQRLKHLQRCLKLKITRLSQEEENIATSLLSLKNDVCVSSMNNVSVQTEWQGEEQFWRQDNHKGSLDSDKEICHIKSEGKCMKNGLDVVPSKSIIEQLAREIAS